MRILRFSLMLVFVFARPAGAQTGSSYWGYSVSGSSPETINAYLTVQGGDMGTCIHTFNDSLVLTGPGGLYGNNNFNNASMARSNGAFTTTFNDLLNVGADGPYSIATSTTGFCSCVNYQFYNSGSQGGTVYPQPRITALTDGNYNSFRPYVDTVQSANQYLIVWGSFLTAAGASNPPTISVNGVSSAGGAISVSGFHLGGGWYVGETTSTGASQINIPYWVDANATPGTYTLTLQTVGGSTSTTFAVRDASPVITSVSPNPWQAGTTVAFTITGSHFGTAAPSLTISPSSAITSSQITNYTDNSIVGNVTLADLATGTASIGVTSNGYGSGFQPAGGASSASPPVGIPISAKPASFAWFTWNPLSTIQASAGPGPGGTYSFSKTDLNSGASVNVQFASGVTSTTSPTTLSLQDAASSGGNTTGGALSTITLTYLAPNGNSVSQHFNVATFGLSCYTTTLESELWNGSTCTTETAYGVVYSGTTTNPPGLSGTFCQSFLKEVLLNGSGVSRGGQTIAPRSNYTSTQSNWSFAPQPLQTANLTTPVANQTIAVDTTIMPFNTNVSLSPFPGTTFIAQDTGAHTGAQAIVGYRIDVYKGLGKAYCPTGFLNSISVGACNPASASCPTQTIPN